MACGSGCCGPPKDTNTANPPTIPVVDDEDSCCAGDVSSCDNSVEDACCGEGNAKNDEYCKPSTAEQDSCYSSSRKPLTTTHGDFCCDSSKDAQANSRDSSCESREAGCGEGCCSNDAAEKSVKPDAYSLKPIEKACAEGCCSGNPAKDLQQSDGESSASSRDTTCEDGCCSNVPEKNNLSKPVGCASESSALAGGKSFCSSTTVQQLKSPMQSCCGPETSDVKTRRCSDEQSISRTSPDSCCATRMSIGNAEKKTSCADECCDEPKIAGITEFITELSTEVSLAIDLEKGPSEREHVILSISGMTCTGCETKLQRTLATLTSITNLRTSLVLARAEFDLDLTKATSEDIIKHLERTTEFKCEKISNQGASLDFICPGDAASFVKGQWPDAVTDVRLVDKDTIRVEFDAKITGARDLLEKGWDHPMRLAPPRPDPTLDAGSKHVRNVGYMTILSAILTIPVLVMAWAPLPDKEIAYGSASLALATIVQVVVAGPFYPKALKAFVFSRIIEMDLLIVLSTSAAFIFSVVSFGYLVAGKPLSTGEFFETSTLLVTLIMVGRFVASLARQKAAESISIRSLQTTNAILVDKSGTETEIDARLLQYGDAFKVIPDSRFPTDGTVISGSSEVNESMITGESRPVEKYKGSSIIAGSINGAGVLTVALNRLPGDNTISTIAGMVDEAKLSKPKIQDIADRVASYFVPVVVTLTVITFVIWVAVGIAVRKQSGPEAVVQALTYAITVLIVSCPCAIGLAVPMVIVIASGVAAGKGVIFKSANSIEVAYKTTDVVFDKTGTLTQGELSIAREEYLGDDSASTKSLLLGLVAGIKHPVSAAVAVHLTAQDILPSRIDEPKALTGKGVEGKFAGQILRAGNSRWLGLSSKRQVQSILSQGLTAFCFTINGTLVAVYGLEDSLRFDALSTISQLQQSGVSVHMLSGDDDGAVQSIASQLNIPNSNVRSRCTPADKQSYIQTLLSTLPPTTSSRKSKTTIVMFCGDGTNDAVALAQATLGIHMSTGTDVAKSAADVVLMRPSLSDILTIIAISRKAIHRIAFNFGWSFVYNLFAILLGAGAFVNARIPPEFAGLGELVSVLPVITAAVALRWSKI